MELKTFYAAQEIENLSKPLRDILLFLEQIDKNTPLDIRLSAGTSTNYFIPPYIVDELIKKEIIDILRKRIEGLGYDLKRL